MVEEVGVGMAVAQLTLAVGMTMALAVVATAETWSGDPKTMWLQAISPPQQSQVLWQPRRRRMMRRSWPTQTTARGCRLPAALSRVVVARHPVAAGLGADMLRRPWLRGQCDWRRRMRGCAVLL